jgi:hypothetical protein
MVVELATSGEPSESPPASSGAIPGASPAARAARTRLCALCSEPLRAGQHLIRVHGNTIHARCTSTTR